MTNRPDPLQLIETAGLTVEAHAAPRTLILAPGLRLSHRSERLMIVERDSHWRRAALAAAAIAAIAFGLGYLAGHVDASTPRSAPESSSIVPPAVWPRGLSGAPSDGLRATAPAPQPTATPDPATTAPPASAWMAEGTMSWVAPSYGDRYLALPIGPGWLVDLCSASCIRIRSTDAGPDLAMQRRGRVADVAVAIFERISGVDRRFGLAPVSWTVVGRG